MNFVHKIILCIFFVTPSLVSAHPDFSRPHISVSGNAVKEVSPDIVVWSLSLRSEGKKPDELAMQHATRLSGLLSYLNQQGIKKDKVQTQHMQLSENWNYNNGKRFKQGYFASSSISFTSSIKTYTELWKGLASQDGVSVSSSQFDIENRIPIQVEARDLALQAAKEKAESMAKALGSKIGKPLLIEDQSYAEDVREPKVMQMRMNESQLADSIVAPGKLDVRMRVHVIFALN